MKRLLNWIKSTMGKKRRPKPPKPLPIPPAPLPVPEPEPPPVPAPEPEPPPPAPIPHPEPPPAPEPIPEPPAPVPHPEPEPTPIPPAPIPPTPIPEPTPVPEPTPIPPPPAPIPAPPPPSTADVRITLDPSKTFQTIEGFGFKQRTWNDGHLVNEFLGGAPPLIITDAQKQEVLDTFRDLGVTRLGLSIQGAGRQATETSPPRFEGVYGEDHVQLVNDLWSRGLTSLNFSVMDYDPWITTAQQMAEWNMKLLRWLRSQGVELEWFSVANEPQYSATSNRWITGEVMAQVIALMGPMLENEGFLTEIFAPDSLETGAAVAQASIIMADPAARPYVKALSTHLYGSRDLSPLKAIAAQYGVPLQMTEYSLPGFDWALIMHDGLVNDCSVMDFMSGFFGAWNAAYSLVVLEVAADGRTYTGHKPTDAYYVMGQWSKYVKPGAVRIEATSSDPRILVSAFVKDGKKTAVVVNTASDTLTVELSGSWKMYRTALLLDGVRWSESVPVAVGGVLFASQSITTFLEV